MPSFIDKHPYSGTEHWVDDNEDAEIRHHVREDVEPLLDYTKEMRAEEAGRRHMKKHDMLHFASIPNVIVMKLLHEYGVNVFDRNDYPRLFKLLNGEFAYLKTTNMVHTVKH